jgi:hypothetical protein
MIGLGKRLTNVTWLPTLMRSRPRLIRPEGLADLKQKTKYQRKQPGIFWNISYKHILMKKKKGFLRISFFLKRTDNYFDDELNAHRNTCLFYLSYKTNGYVITTKEGAWRNSNAAINTGLATVAITTTVLGRRMSIHKMLRKRIPLHPSWNYIIFTWINR